MRIILIWIALVAALAIPIAIAANSPLLAWRDPIYIVAGFAGIIAMALLFIQPLLIGGYLPGLSLSQGRSGHRWIGACLVLAVLIHVGALWITSPPDVIDALTFASPTPFSLWGVIAMWAVFTSALLAVFRRRLRLQPRHWRKGHSFLAVIIILTTILHALLIEGTMETISKIALAILLIIATLKATLDLRIWVNKPNKRPSARAKDRAK